HHGDVHALFGSGGGQALADEIGVELLGKVPLEPAVSAAGDIGEPVVLTGTSPAAEVFKAIARKIVEEIAPPVNMSGCSARMLSLMVAALEARDEQNGEQPLEPSDVLPSSAT
ncbi:MAG: P-loop NTPase, partial [Ilumatobacteraceae bacterium]